MKTKRIVILLAVLGFFISNINAQSDTEWRSGKQVNDVYSHNWSFGAGINVVEDGNEIFGGFLNPNEYWNFSRPFYINAEYYLNNKLSFNAMVSMNQYKADKHIDHLYIIEGHEASYFAFDLAAKLYFRDWLKTYKFDPYISAGFGFTNIGEYQGVPVDKYAPDQSVVSIESIGRPTVNAGIGFNVWFSQNWGLNLNTAGKWGVATGDHEKAGNDVSNQLQYTMGVLYFLSN